MDNLKADIFADLLAGTGIGATPPGPVTNHGPTPPVPTGAPTEAPLPGPRRGVLELTAPLSVLIGLNNTPGLVAATDR